MSVGEVSTLIAEADTDEDGTPNCQDACAWSALKITPGVCGCEQPDVDTDNDGVLDCLDRCPADVAKTLPGTCGCGVADVDADGFTHG